MIKRYILYKKRATVELKITRITLKWPEMLRTYMYVKIGEHISLAISVPGLGNTYIVP